MNTLTESIQNVLIYYSYTMLSFCKYNYTITKKKQNLKKQNTIQTSVNFGLSHLIIFNSGVIEFFRNS